MKYILIELFSDMSSNDIRDCRLAGDYIKIDSIKGIQLIDILMEDHVEFAVHEVGNCLLDKSYEYWEDTSDFILPSSRAEIEGKE